MSKDLICRHAPLQTNNTGWGCAHGDGRGSRKQRRESGKHDSIEGKLSLWKRRSGRDAGVVSGLTADPIFSYVLHSTLLLEVLVAIHTSIYIYILTRLTGWPLNASLNAGLIKEFYLQFRTNPKSLKQPFILWQWHKEVLCQTWRTIVVTAVFPVRRVLKKM